MVFQDPTDSLNPRYTAARAIADPLLRFGGPMTAAALRTRCEDLAATVGLPLDLLDRFPHQLSGGQKARVGIARAIALKPDLVVLDEPTAALDVSVQALVLNLLADLKAQLGMSYLFVSHDLHVVRLICDRVIVMKSGRIVEQGSVDDVLRAPRHPYTQSLLAAVPVADPGAVRPVLRLEGDLPSPVNPPAGCHFHPRCGVAVSRCSTEYPDAQKLSATHVARCHLCNNG
jgi:peptide/nickel transport system ATP-binding protein